MFKKILSLSLSLVLVLSLTAGCGEAGTGTDTGDGSTETTETNTGTEASSDVSGGTYVAELPTGVEEADIFVEPIEGLSDDFIKGVDISTVLSEEESGVVYRNADGVEEDIFKILADSGVNYIRVRVWNDPYDENGNGYGGGNCDYTKAAEIGRRAAQYGMKLLVDFHYSDFWADPGKQMVPKAWEGMTIEEKAEAAYTYTLEAMNAILDAGADVGIVQLGNETTTGMCGETTWANISQIMKKGREAVLEAGAAHGNNDIKIAVHFTNVDNADAIYTLIRKMKSSDVQYDIFGISFYSYWHGTFENLVEVMNNIVEKTGKPVLILENSYAYTLEDGDGTGNSVSEKDLIDGYTASVQSQANEVRDVCAAVASLGENGLGVFYWEPAWVPVRNTNGAWSDENEKLWETYGSGWASSYAAEYDPDDAGKYYGGSAWDNQAMFDFDGKALPSLSVWKYLKYGTTCELKCDFVHDVTIELKPGDELVLPETVEVQYNDRSRNGMAPVTWSETDIQAVDLTNAGDYVITGTLEDGTTLSCYVVIRNANLVENSSFEDADRSAWNIEELNAGTVDYQEKSSDAASGDWAMHYWSSDAVEFEVTYKVTDLLPGTYKFSINAQGGGGSDTDVLEIFVKDGDTEYTQKFSVDGWCNWKTPTIEGMELSGGDVTIGIRVKAVAGAWGTMDDIYFARTD